MRPSQYPATAFVRINFFYDISPCTRSPCKARVSIKNPELSFKGTSKNPIRASFRQIFRFAYVFYVQINVLKERKKRKVKVKRPYNAKYEHLPFPFKTKNLLENLRKAGFWKSP